MVQLVKVAKLLQDKQPSGGSTVVPSGTIGQPFGLLLALTSAV